MDVWAGDIEISNGKKIESVAIVANGSSKLALDGVSLHFLARVDIARVPLYLIVGPQLDVYSEASDTVAWFSDQLISGATAPKSGQSPWWLVYAAQSPIGILVEARGASGRNKDSQTVTELLFYAQSSNPTSSPTIHALPLCSDDIRCAPLTPSPSPPPDHVRPSVKSTHEDIVSCTDAEFLPSLHPPYIGDSNVNRHTKFVSELFDNASNRRKRARHNGGGSIAAAAAGADPASAITSRGLGNGGSGLPASQRRPSVDGRRTTDPGVIAPKALTASRRSSSCLSHVETQQNDDGDDNSIERTNKSLISRLVMTGMRAYGLQQRKKTSASDSQATQLDSQASTDSQIGSVTRDDEYKLVYHQVYRGTVFTMRSYIATEALVSHTEQMRETVDRLLAIFCTDPLAAPVEMPSANVIATPGRKQPPFGTTTGGFDDLDPFVQ